MVPLPGARVLRQLVTDFTDEGETVLEAQDREHHAAGLSILAEQTAATETRCHMPDALDELLAKIQREHGPRAIYRPPAMVPAGKWTSPIEARLVDDDDDEPEPVAVEPAQDPYSPDPRLYPPEWLAEFDRRCAAAVADMNAAIQRARNER